MLYYKMVRSLKNNNKARQTYFSIILCGSTRMIKYTCKASFTHLKCIFSLHFAALTLKGFLFVGKRTVEKGT